MRQAMRNGCTLGCSGDIKLHFNNLNISSQAFYHDFLAEGPSRELSQFIIVSTIKTKKKVKSGSTAVPKSQ